MKSNYEKYENLPITTPHIFVTVSPWRAFYSQEMNTLMMMHMSGYLLCKEVLKQHWLKETLCVCALPNCEKIKHIQIWYSGDKDMEKNTT